MKRPIRDVAASVRQRLSNAAKAGGRPAADVLHFMLGQFTVPAGGHDPLAVIDVPIPLLPGLLGLMVHSQVFNAFGTVTGQPRIRNWVTTTLQN